MAVVARVFPRHWDGRRLLQFLTGLALIALAFAAPALAASPGTTAPATVVTTVDAPAGSALVDRVVAPEPRLVAGDEGRSTTPGDAARAASESPAADAGSATAPQIAGQAGNGRVPVVSTDAAGAGLLCHRDVPDLSSVAQHPYAGRAPPRA